MLENSIYQQFLKENPSFGYLKVQIFTAEQGIPISDVNIKIQKEIKNQIFTIYTGKTDESGIVKDIKLPAPDITDYDLPTYTSYELIVNHPRYQGPNIFIIPIYSNQKMIQYINLTPIYQEVKND